MTRAKQQHPEGVLEKRWHPAGVRYNNTLLFRWSSLRFDHRLLSF